MRSPHANSCHRRDDRIRRTCRLPAFHGEFPFRARERTGRSIGLWQVVAARGDGRTPAPELWRDSHPTRRRPRAGSPVARRRGLGFPGLQRAGRAVVCRQRHDRRRERASLALDLVRLGGRADQRANTLSGGELQRLALARGLAADAGAVFADEPTANLDEANTRQVASILQGLSGSTTIVVATHDPLLIAAADDVIRLRPSL